ncbi:MAG: tRNA-dihydrouridine synthase family protein [Puniceicoccales bacterium]|nr:tRNA-dihydrouridine synthase family protein [Puniceicoccales bacterium]
MNSKDENGKNFPTALAPMCGLTTRHFFNILCDFGEPDEYISEFLRVHPTATICKKITDLIENRRSTRPLSIQLLGKDPQHLARIAEQLGNCAIHGINLNLGCPVPKIRKKGVGGSLLVDLNTVDSIISALLNSTNLPISVKTRIGYWHASEFDEILKHLSSHSISKLYLHRRTVRGLYEEQIDLGCIKLAKAELRCPVIANGDIKTASEALHIIEETGADGVMIGRAAISNPWIFRQICSLSHSSQAFIPSGSDYLDYIERLKNFTDGTGPSEHRMLSSMKKYAVPIADFVDKVGDFSCKIRRAETLREFHGACEKFFTAPDFNAFGSG